MAPEKAPKTVSETCGKWLQFGPVNETWGLALKQLGATYGKGNLGPSSVCPDVGIKNIQSFLEVLPFTKWPQKMKISEPLCKKICRHDLSNIAQSGYTGSRVCRRKSRSFFIQFVFISKWNFERSKNTCSSLWRPRRKESNSFKTNQRQAKKET